MKRKAKRNLQDLAVEAMKRGNKGLPDRYILQAQKALYEDLMAIVDNLKPDTYLLGCRKHWSDDSSATCTCDENEATANQFFNKAKAEIRTKLAQYFNQGEAHE